MNAVATGIEGVLRIDPVVHGDSRGFFLESWNARRFADHGVHGDFTQDNHSRSGQWVLRGLHYQMGDAAQGKLVRVTRGEVFDVAVDLRRSSPTFGRWHGEHLSEHNHRQLWIPPGCAHGFLVLSESTDFQYKCTGRYRPDAERTLRWDCSEVGIEWPLDGNAPVLSEKDRDGGLPLSECEHFA